MSKGTCPKCNGRKHFTTLLSKHDEPRDNLTAADCIPFPVDCEVCNGTGEVELPVPAWRAGRNVLSLVKS